MQHTFDSADLVIGEGQASRRIKVLDVRLEIETAPRDYVPPPGLDCPFLNGKIRAEGTLTEACRPGGSLLAPGRQAVLKLGVQGMWSLARILILDLAGVRPVSPGLRHYDWKLMVTGQASDALKLFATPGSDPNVLEIEDLLALLGADPSEVGRGADGQKVIHDSEGGFRIQESQETPPDTPPALS